MENKEIVKGSEKTGKDVSMKLLVSILVLTVVLSLVVSYFVVSLTPQQTYSKDTGEILVEVVNPGDEMFTAGGEIVVEVIDGSESS
jgi:preprotein translocase subunit YajC